VAVPVLVVLLSVVGFVITTRAVSEERGSAAQRRAEVQALEVQGQLERARAFAIGLGNALEGERVPDGRRFAALVGSATTTVGLTAAAWVERVAPGGRRDYERRIRAPITGLSGRQVAGPATYLPATFVTGVAVRPGTDVARVPALAATLRDPTSVFAGTATPVASLAGQRGFFVVQGAQFGQGPGSRGFLVVFVPADWLRVSLNLDPQRTAISLDGRRLDGAPGAAPAAGHSLEALTRRWRVDVAREPATALQSRLPWLAAAWPPATALIVYLLGRGILRRRRAERQVDDIFDLSPDLLCVAGLDGYFKRVNPAFEQTLGHDAAELLARPFMEFVHPDDRERLATMIGALSEGRDVSDFEIRFIRADGTVRRLQWNTRTMPEKGLMYAAARDVTENRMLSNEQAALRRVATLVAEGHDAGELFDAVALEVGRLLGADATRLVRYQKDGTASVVGAYGASDPELGAGSDASLDGGRLWGRVAQSRSAESTRDGPDPLDESLLATGAAVAVPIVVSGRPWGAIVAAWKQPDMAGGDTEVRMAQFTELVATAVANAESGAELAASRRRIVATADEARRRIERDLHDGAQQRLVSTVVALRLARKELGDANGPVADLVDEALGNAQRGIDEVRELARGIHPRVLSSGGLGPALKKLAQRTAVPVKVDLQTDARLPENVEVAAYYVASEALTNVAKHAQASAVCITANVDDRCIVLSIRDDGVGGADPSRGSGLIGLHDRVVALGGSLAVQSEPGAGTVLTAQIPVPAPTAAGADA
jgi:PAS domain S-box-containing protein